MSLKRPAKEQPENFEFNSSSLDMVNKIIAKYPKGKHAGEAKHGKHAKGKSKEAKSKGKFPI